MSQKKFLVIGGGAAGFFAALIAKEAYPDLNVTLLEKTAIPLAKVRVSGGGRCNVTHSCFDPRVLSQNYPRGFKELLGPFHSFQPKDTIEWFNRRGIQLKSEKDGRMFPTTDSSETIIQCFLSEAKKLGVDLQLRKKISGLSKTEEGFAIHCKDDDILTCDSLLLATGSSKQGYEWAMDFGHTIQSPVPSLFTFNVPSSALSELSGISVPDVTLRIKDLPQNQRGAILITHFGFSGPSVIKLSAWAARPLNECQYRGTLLINWLPNHSSETIYSTLRNLKQTYPHELLASKRAFDLPKKLWVALLEDLQTKKLQTISDKALRKFSEKLCCDPYQIEGKTTHKEEFVTCGGVTLSEVDFRTMESKIHPNLYFAGEVLDIDGVTGGFNFQNAWTTGYLAGMAQKTPPA